MSSFNIVDQTGKVREAENIVNFDFESVNYCLYSVRRDNENYNLFVSKIIIHNFDNVELFDLEGIEKNKLTSVVNFIVENNEISSLKSAGIKIVNDIVLYNSDNLLFNTSKAYLYSIKYDDYIKLKNRFSDRISDTNQYSFNNLLCNSNIELKDDIIRFKSDISQVVNENSNTLFEGSDKDLNAAKDIIKKITIEKLNINNDEDLKKIFIKEKIKKPTWDSGFVTGNITLFILGTLSFFLISILLILYFS